jgi:hypothetical protein
MRSSLAWLQSWLQLTPFAVVRPSSCSSKRAGESAYGTAVNRYERDQLGLAVWGSGVRVPSAPPIRQAVLRFGERLSSSLVPAWWALEPLRRRRPSQRIAHLVSGVAA